MSLIKKYCKSMNWVSVQIYSSLFSKGEENHNYMKKLRRKLFDGKGGGGEHLLNSLLWFCQQLGLNFYYA